MDEKLKYFINENNKMKDNKIAEATEHLTKDSLSIEEVKLEDKLTFEQLIYGLPKEDTITLLQYLSALMQTFAASRTQGVIPWFVDQLGARLAKILNNKDKEKEQGK